MSESGDRPGDAGHEDPTSGAFDAARDPWARPPEQPPADETVRLTKGPPAGDAGAPDQAPPGNGPPAYEPPRYEQPTYEPPQYGQPTYEQPSYPPPGAAQQPYNDPSQQAGYGQPYAQPGYGAADAYQQYGQQAYGQPPGYGPPGYPAPGYSGGAYGYGGPTNSGKATAVMVLGIAAVVTVWCYWLGIIPAIVALAMAGSAKRDIEASGGRLTGAGMVTAGRVTSWIAIGVGVLVAVIIGLFIAFADTTSAYTGN